MFSMLALLLMAVSGAWAQKYTVAFTSEYTSVPSIYAGNANYFQLDIENTSEVAGTNVLASVYVDDVLVWSETVDNIPAGETVNLDVVDPTIRPVDENTVIGHDNKEAVYKVVLSDGIDEDIQKEFSFVILYNGNLGKEYAYPFTQPFLREFSFTGDVQVLVSEEYSASGVTSREDAFAVELGGGSVHKALLYVAYNWDKAAEGDFNSWTTTFNGQTIVPIANYRDQGNLGKYGVYGYGMVVYDVTEAVVDGDNTFALQKTAGNVAVHPSSLIVMIDNPSADPKVIYIAEEADLLSTTNNHHVEPIYNSSFKDVADGEATLYVFAANAQAGEGDLAINGDFRPDIWSGTSNSVEVYETAVESGDISIQFKSTGSTILALQQMVVVKKTSTGIETVDSEQLTFDSWYTINGVKLDDKPTEKGVYILNGVKVWVE